MLSNIFSIILAAGRGSRMKGQNKNKTVISLLPDYEYPMIVEILQNTPPGRKLIVVNYRKEDIFNVTHNLGNVIYCEQSELNGTGGAILAASDILKMAIEEYIIITMGDVPLVKKRTYQELIKGLKENELVVLGFEPEEKRQYGLLEIEGNRVRRIIEWNTWKEFSEEEQERYRICNSGIYAINKKTLLDYIPVLSSRPHIVKKERDGVRTNIKEYFLTDLVEYMHDDGLSVGYKIAHETEVIGVDDNSSLKKAREIFISKRD